MDGSAAGMTAGVPSGDLETELENVCRELGLVNAKVSELLDTQSSLQARRDRLSTEIQARKKRREYVYFTTLCAAAAAATAAVADATVPFVFKPASSEQRVEGLGTS